MSDVFGRRKKRNDEAVIKAINESAKSADRWSRRNFIIATAGLAAAIAVPTVVFLLDDDEVPEPFDIVVEVDPDQIIDANGAPVGASYLLDLPIDEVPAPPNRRNRCDGRFEWASELGGVQADVSVLRVSIEGLRSDTARLLGLEAVITENSIPAGGTHLSCPGRGAITEIQQVGITLLPGDSTLVVTDPEGEPIPFQFELPQGDVEVFEVSAFAPDCDCRWHLLLTFESAGQRSSLIIDNDGADFRTVSARLATTYHFLDGTWVDIDAAADAGVAPTPDEEPAVAPDVEPHEATDGEATCPLMNSSEVAVATGLEVEELFWSENTTPGASGPLMLDTRCSFSVSSSDNAQTVISVIVNELDSASAARSEFDEQLRLYTRGAPESAALTETDDSVTAVLDFATVQLRGNRILTAQVDPAILDNSAIAEELIDTLTS